MSPADPRTPTWVADAPLPRPGQPGYRGVRSPAQPGAHWVLIDNTEEALLAQWRKDADGLWEGLVARVGGIDDLWAEWIPAAQLVPHRH